MISVDELLFDIDLKLNKNSNLEHQSIPDETKIDVLNTKQDELLIKKIGLNNNYQLGLDSFRKRYEDLQVLIVPYSKLVATKVADDILNSYESDISLLPTKLFLPIDSYVLATRNECKNRRLKVIEIVKHGDLQLKLESPHYSPSFEYQETLSTISNNLFYTYSDLDNSFEINEIYLTYLRYPRRIDIAGYIHLDGSPSITQDCELDSYLKDELVNLVVEELAKSTGNQELVQNTLRGISKNE